MYRLTDEIAVVNTVDFFTPVVDDPFTYGQISAANSLSDVYAMGGTPKTALNIVCWPQTGLPGEMLGEILRGGAEKAREAGVVIVGGHTVADEEVKFGMAITGVIDPRRIVRNVGAQVGDALVLTKALGTGILMTASARPAGRSALVTAITGPPRALICSIVEMFFESRSSAGTTTTLGIEALIRASGPCFSSAA